MPFCPKCRYEYRQGIETCPDCDERLVYELQKESDKAKSGLEKRYDDWVHIAKFSSPIYADMVVEALKARDIPAVILQGSSLTFGHFGTSVQGLGSGGFTLMIPREHIEEADKEAAEILGDEWESAKLVDLG
ncbi:MAG: DUF2007 domain-containing protein [candidate division Zixibacteria bacterium]|nr:DUF2007 domain-containing protein [candidate division Zixibacteria bacterium]